MHLTTQIGGTNRAKVTVLKRTLQQLDIKVARPTAEEAAGSVEKNPWQRYESELAFFESIAMSSFHLILNQEALTREQGLQVLYAMLKGRPVVLVEEPRFTSEVDAFTRETVTAHRAELKVEALPEMEPAELNYLLKNIETHVEYSLSAHEEALIKSHVKAYFRDLLEDAKQALLSEPTAILQKV